MKFDFKQKNHPKNWTTKNFDKKWTTMMPLLRPMEIKTYRQTSKISRTLVGNELVDHSDVVGASPVGAAPTTSSPFQYRE